MSDQASRTAAANARRAQRTLDKHLAVEQAIASFMADGRAITVKGLAEAVGTSRQFIYDHHEDAVAAAQVLQRHQGVGTGPSTRHAAVEPGLRADLLYAQETIRALRGRVTELEDQLRQAVGTQVASMTLPKPQDVADKQQQIDRLLSERDAALTDARDWRRQADRLERQLAVERRAHAATSARLASAQDDDGNVVPIQ